MKSVGACRTLAVLWMCGAVGCATVTPVMPPLVREDRRPELRPMPPDPATEPLAGNMPKGDWVEALEAGSCLDGAGKAVQRGPCPARAGILLSEERAVRDGLFRLRYVELRRTFEADRQIWDAHRDLYEERLKAAEERLRASQPDWWQRHATELGVVAGFVLGTGITMGLVYALAPSTK